jgi:hypothetical protein
VYWRNDDCHSVPLPGINSTRTFSGLGSERMWCRQEDNIRMDLMEIDWEGVYWIHLAQDKD